MNINRITERGETHFVGVDGPLSYCGEFQTPTHITPQWHPS